MLPENAVRDRNPKESFRPLAIIPAGEHKFETPKPNPNIRYQDQDQQFDRYGLGAQIDYPRQGMTQTALSSRGAGASCVGSTWGIEKSIETTLQHQDKTDEVKLNIEVTSQSPELAMTTDLTVPLIMLQVELDSTDHVHQLIVTDQDGKQLTCYHQIQEMPLYAVDIPEGEGRPLSFHYHSEPMVDIEFTIPSPYPLIQRLTDAESKIDATLAPDERQWKLIKEFRR